MHGRKVSKFCGLREICWWEEEGLIQVSRLTRTSLLTRCREQRFRMKEYERVRAKARERGTGKVPRVVVN
jgi:hypothetical protein